MESLNNTIRMHNFSTIVIRVTFAEMGMGIPERLRYCNSFLIVLRTIGPKRFITGDFIDGFGFSVSLGMIRRASDRLNALLFLHQPVIGADKTTAIVAEDPNFDTRLWSGLYLL